MNLSQIISFFKSIKKSLWIYFKGQNAIVSFEEMQYRKNICYTCENLVKENQKVLRCKECNCILKFKISLAVSECPIDKWGSVNTF